ncbi:MAG: hypothetical protein C4523_04620 [Myxococcales bacterium]|nr:MAG: hypothetical protein C4523_04620 [Myxococcales bacterium]
MPKPSAIHRHLTFCRVEDDALLTALLADRLLAPLIVASWPGGWLAVARKDEERLRARLEVLGARPRLDGRWLR